MRRWLKGLTACFASIAMTIAFAGCSGGEVDDPDTDPPEVVSGSADSGDSTGGDSSESNDTASKGGDAAPAGWGTIKGRIVFAGTVPEPEILVKKGDADVKDAPRCGAEQIRSETLVVDPETKGVRDAVIYLLKVAKSSVHPDLANPPGEPAELGQEYCQFVPHVVALREGQGLKITSSDPGVAHNTKITGIKNAGFNQILPGPEAEGSKSEMDGPKLLAETLGLRVECNVHNWMSAYIWVFEHPYFVRTGKDGSFEIKNVPAGKHSLVTWQEQELFVNDKTGPDKRKARRGFEITVEADGVTDLGEIKIGG